MLKSSIVYLAIVLSATVARADAGQDCMQTQDLRRQIMGCTAYLRQSQGSAQQMAQAYVLRATAYVKQNQADLAAADFDQAIRLNANDWRAYVGRGELHERVGQLWGAVWGAQDSYDKAAADFDRALQLLGTAATTKSSAPFEQVAASLRDHRDCDQGKDAKRRIQGCSSLIRGMQGAPNAAFYVNRGDAYTDQHDYGRALADFNQALAVNSKYVTAYLDRGDVYRLQGRYALAAKDYAQAAQLVEAIIAKQPDPQSSALVKTLRDRIVALRDRIVEMNSYNKLEGRWVEYLKEIQADNDHPHWSGNPYDLYRTRHGFAAD